ncbi:glycosyltransferase family 2 protein [Pectobacterium quasiaquaticum]|uniref:glycosyltransferase family 2 protein n=1 Tax=Pectobacterium quasiaquaticum TaxID=2774015 RepID=UPI00187721DB|nr:glycosyltransferase family 2 protein [Pectobacterium quasiaquaticum]MBE5215360.1 glycosyltransferase family 2 protein [Pectobacterium quasiaquaticum]MBE5227420.1 glycosyltransferase family 2 protein [Pectobacterium quasiaquaticum]URG51613.1 glycosyltransferase family 2 protein [Pectobacterium quasiaquaticum]
MSLSENPKIGLVTVLYNGMEVLPDFFASLAVQTYKNFILYVIDNSPNNDALNLAKALSEEYKINSIFINNNENLGVAAGNNIGIKLSLKECDYTLLLNNDIDFKNNTLSDIVSFSCKNKEYLVAPKIYYAGTNKIWMAGGDISSFKGCTSHRGDKEEDLGQYNNTEHVAYAPTCFMLIDNKVFHDIGFMDEKYFVYFDDTDFIYRAKLYGYKICYYPKVYINHKVSFTTGGDDSPFSIFYSNRNRFYFIKKNFTGISKSISLMFFLFTRIIRYMQFNSEQKKSLLKAMKMMWNM